MDLSPLIPTTRPEYVACIAGIVLGCIATFISWGKNNHENWSNKKSTLEAIKNDSRAAMFYLALVGVLAAIGIDWDWKTDVPSQALTQQNKTGKPTPKTTQGASATGTTQQQANVPQKPTKFEAKTKVGFFYIFYYLLAGFVAFCIACIVMYNIGKNKIRLYKNEYIPTAGQTILNYIKFGYLYAINEIEKNELAELKKLRDGESEFNTRRNRALYDLCDKIGRLLHKPEARAKNDLIESILETLRNNSRKYMGHNCNANYMEAIPADRIGSTQLNLHFTHDENPHYTHYLVVRSWASNVHDTPEGFALPVETDGRGSICPRTLPGAPEAYLGKPYIGDLSEPYENPQLPAQVVREINDYFSTKSLKCFISTKIPVKTADNTGWLGVINIESDDDLLVKLESKDHENFRDSILVFGALLGIVASVKV